MTGSHLVVLWTAENHFNAQSLHHRRHNPPPITSRPLGSYRTTKDCFQSLFPCLNGCSPSNLLPRAFRNLSLSKWLLLYALFVLVYYTSIKETDSLGSRCDSSWIFFPTWSTIGRDFVQPWNSSSSCISFKFWLSFFRLLSAGRELC